MFAFQNQEIKLDGLTVIVGLNNSGKTTIINEIWHTDVDGNCIYPIKLDVYDMDNYDHYCRHCGLAMDGIINE